MQLRDWIMAKGFSDAARAMRVSLRAVRSYRHGTRHPSAQVCGRLPRVTKGCVTELEDVFEDDLS
jgi:predicted transcriptional regulator